MKWIRVNEDMKNEEEISERGKGEKAKENWRKLAHWREAKKQIRGREKEIDRKEIMKNMKKRERRDCYKVSTGGGER